jgi:TetR/AcrR family transcriptional regulator
VIEPAHVILHTLLKRGVDRGEFAPIENYDDAVHAVISGVMFLLNWKHSLGACAGHQPIEPKQFIANFAHILTHGLVAKPVSAKAIGSKKTITKTLVRKKK